MKENDPGAETISARTILLIPSFNVAAYLPELIEISRSFIPAENIIVIDDGSTDGTGSAAIEAGVVVLRNERNMGKGAALVNGIEYAFNKPRIDWIITIDGDLQHDPASIPEFLKTAESGRFDLIIGRRKILGSMMPLDRRFSNSFSSWIVSRLTGQKLYDIQCGYRMIGLSMLRDMDFVSAGYEFELEILLKIVRKKGKIGWITVPTRYGDASSSIRRMRDTMSFIRIILKYLFGKL